MNRLPAKITSLYQVDNIRPGAIGVLTGNANFYVFEWPEGGPGRSTIATFPVERYLQLAYCFKPVTDFSPAVAAPESEPPRLRSFDNSGVHLPQNHPQRKEINWGKFWSIVREILDPKRSEFEALATMILLFIAALVINQHIVHVSFFSACVAFLAGIGFGTAVSVVVKFFTRPTK